MSIEWAQLFRSHASVFSLNEDTKEWSGRGASGTIIMFQNSSNREDVRIKWTKGHELWWRLTSSKLKPKGERALVLKAWGMQNNQQEILAVRFSHQEAAILFAKKYQSIFPKAIAEDSSIDDLFKPEQNSDENNKKRNSLYVKGRNHESIASLPGSILAINEEFQQFEPQQSNSYESHDDKFEPNMNEFPNHNNVQKGPPPPPQGIKAVGPPPRPVKKMVKASENMKPPMWAMNQPQQKQQHLKQEEVKLEYGNGDEESWRCEVCTYHNVAGATKCIMCAFEKGGKKKEVPIDDDGFGDLPAEKEEDEDEDEIVQNPGQGSDDDANKWQCRICTYSNHSWTDRCEVCQAVRKIDAPKKPPQDSFPSSPIYNVVPAKNPNFQFGEWICSICTLKNDATSQRCVACNAVRNMAGHGHGDINSMMDHLVHSPEQQYNPMGYNYANMNQPMPYFDSNDPFANNVGKNNGFFESTVEDFSRAASDISCYNKKPSSVFSTLRSVAKKLLKDEARYRTLDTTNPKVMERLIGFDGVLDFLRLLGFESDAVGAKLICKVKPSANVVQNAITVLNSYQQRFRMTQGGPMMNQFGGYPGANYMAQPYPMQGFQGGGYPQYGGMNGGFNMQLHGQPQYNVELQQSDPWGSPSSSHVHKVQPKPTRGGDEDALLDNNQDNEKTEFLTLEQIILWGTNENIHDNETMETLILTHKMFTDSLTLLKQLRHRFFVSIPVDILNLHNQKKKQDAIKEFQSGIQKRIQLKVMKALRDWMKRYWQEDFHLDNDVQNELQEWLKELSVYNKLDVHNVNCVWIPPLYNAVKKEYSRSKQIDWNKRIKQKKNILSAYDDVPIDANKINAILSKTDSEDLAEQITLMDFEIFSNIQSREYTGQRWNGKDKDEMAPNIIALIDQHNMFSNWLQVQVLRERSLRKRVVAIKRIIKMGQHFEQLKNYNSLMAVFTALSTSAIHRLKLAWSRVPDRSLIFMKKCAALFSTTQNSRTMRTVLTKAGGNPCVPHLGIYLQDLIGFEEGNKKKVAMDAFHGKKMLNFVRCLRVADRIRNIQLFQQHRYSDTIQQKRLLQKILLIEFYKLKDVSEDQLWEMSTDVKAQDQKHAKQGWFAGGNDGYREVPKAQPKDNGSDEDKSNVNPLL